MEKTKAQIEAEKAFSDEGIDNPKLDEFNIRQKCRRQGFVSGYQKAEEHSLEKIKDFAIAFAKYEGGKEGTYQHVMIGFLQTKEAQDILNKQP